MKYKPQVAASRTPKDAARTSKPAKSNPRPTKIDAARPPRRAPSKSDLATCGDDVGAKPSAKVARRGPSGKRGVVLVPLLITVVIVIALLLGRRIEIRVYPGPVAVVLR
jgi:hypothetical protein